VDKALVKAMVIGDGSLSIRRSHGFKNAQLRILHAFAQRDYLLWKRELLADAGIGSHYWESESVTNPYTGKRAVFCTIETRAYPGLTDLFFSMYPKKDGFDPGILDDLGPLHLAIIYQDDGGKVTANTVRYGTRSVPTVEPYVVSYRIALQSHGDKGVSQFCEWMGQRFGITARPLLVPSGYTVAIYRKADKANFRNLIQPFVHPTMMYKLEGTFEAHVDHRERLSERESFEENPWAAMQQSELPGIEPEEDGPKSLSRLERLEWVGALEVYK
jgi:hypothetical protein